MPLDYFHTAALLGNLLSLPNQFEDERQQSEVTRMILGQLAQQPGGPQFTPQQMEAYAPTPPNLGVNVPYLGPVIRGVGTIGQVLQGVLGTAPPAPRPPIPELNALAELQKRNKQEAGRIKVADLFKQHANPDEIRAAAVESGVPVSGLGLNQPKSNPYMDWKAQNPNKSPTDFLRETAEARRLPVRPNWTEQDYLNHHPGASGEDFMQFQADLAVGKAGRIADARASAADRWKHLPPQAQKSLAQIDTVRGFTGEIEELLNTPDVKALEGQHLPVGDRVAKAIERRVVNKLYLAGFAESPDLDALQGFTSFARVAGAAPFMGGARALPWIREIQQHMPKGTDEPQLIREKLKLINGYLDNMQNSVESAATRTMGDIKKDRGNPKRDVPPADAPGQGYSVEPIQ